MRSSCPPVLPALLISRGPSGYVRLLVTAFSICLLTGCCGEEEVATLKEMYDDERALPAVFLEAESKEQKIAPGDRGMFVEDGKLYWPALTCHNPDCPAKGTEENPHLFISPDPAVIANPDGTVGYDRSRVDEADNYFGNCPECLKIRKLAAESDEDRQRYSNWAVPYVLPETKQRREELAAARKAREEALKRRMGRDAE